MLIMITVTIIIVSRLASLYVDAVLKLLSYIVYSNLKLFESIDRHAERELNIIIILVLIRYILFSRLLLGRGRNSE